MKSVTADFNRRGPQGTVKVSLRRFSEAPAAGEQFIAVEGEDRYVGTVRSVDGDSRTVLLEMDWDQPFRGYINFSMSVESSGTSRG